MCALLPHQQMVLSSSTLSARHIKWYEPSNISNLKSVLSHKQAQGCAVGQQHWLIDKPVLALGIDLHQ